MLVDKTIPGAAAVNQKGKWDYLIGVGLACFIGLLNGSLSGDSLKCTSLKGHCCFTQVYRCCSLDCIPSSPVP